MAAQLESQTENFLITNKTIKTMKTTKLFLFIVIVLLLSNCKKEKETDNPNIIHRVINKEVISKGDFSTDYTEIDIDDNSVIDYILEIKLQKFSKSTRFLGKIPGNESLATAASNEDPFVVNKLSKNSTINSTSTIWNQLPFLANYSYDLISTIKEDGYAGNGDVMVGVKFLIDGNTHFGWIIMNTSASYKYAIVKEVAYDIRPNIAIKAGEK